jgi:hypothetical protein
MIIAVERSNRRHPLVADEREAFATKYPTDEFPFGAAWLDGNYKLHRLGGTAAGTGKLELYNLDTDAAEANDLAKSEPERVKRMSAALEAWQRSVLNSLNGGDYGATADKPASK